MNKRSFITYAGIVACLPLLLLFSCNRNTAEKTSASGQAMQASQTSSSQSTQATRSASQTTQQAPSGTPSGSTTVPVKAPVPTRIDTSHLADGLYAEMQTSKGTILLALDYKKVPLTVTNFVGLAQGTIKSTRNGKPFYDGLTFHRVVANFMIQGGDPLGNGMGGPGYTFPDEIRSDLKFDGPGVLAMANAGPNTNGSQFFITHVATPWLDGHYSIFGHVVQGQDVVNAIQQGDKIIKVTIIRVGTDAKAFKADQQNFDKLRSEALQRLASAAQEQKKKAEQTIAKKWPKAVKDASGIYYIIEKKGTGTATPNDSSTVTVNYIGTLLDGTEFDNSYKRGQPLTFKVDQVIKGWGIAIKQMKKGEKRLVIIPPNLGYGAAGAGNGLIPPNAYLVFDIELLDFK